MGKKAKGSRKGKKAWRANISTDDIDEYFQKSTKDALSGGPLTSVPNNSLFYVDKSTDIPVKRKIEKHREKVLHSESVLERNPFVKPIPSSTLKKSKKKKKLASKEKPVTQESSKDGKDLGSSLSDIWDEEGEGTSKDKKRPVASHIPAVEIEPLGCSFNPPFEAHQDSLAQAVAVEMQKSYRKELGPEPIPLIVPGEELDEEEKYFLDADDVDDDMEEDENGDSLVQRALKNKRVTRVELNRRARRQEKLKAEEEAKKLEKLSKEIDCIPNIIEEIAKDDEEKLKKHVRCVVAKQERLRAGPPRLGKHKFEPAPLQVLLSEEISGSLRKLKGCCTLARDRYKSYEKRGVVVPRAKRNRNLVFVC